MQRNEIKIKIVETLLDYHENIISIKKATQKLLEICEKVKEK